MGKLEDFIDRASYIAQHEAINDYHAFKNAMLTRNIKTNAFTDCSAKQQEEIYQYMKNLLDSCNDMQLCDNAIGSLFTSAYMTGFQFAIKCFAINGMLDLSS